MNEKIEQKPEKEKVYYGAITVFYKKENGEVLYLIVKNTKTGNVSFVSGAKEGFEDDLKQTAQRENLEELGINSDDYKLQEIDVKQEFVFGPNKPERAGCKSRYQVFIADLSNYDSEISYTEELEWIKWLPKKEAFEQLTFPDIKEVFEKTIRFIG